MFFEEQKYLNKIINHVLNINKIVGHVILLILILKIQLIKTGNVYIKCGTLDRR